jgi:nucleoside-diphosphate-sugar epimerase
VHRLKVLVTGASGYVGRQVIAPLEDLGFEVVPAGRAQGVDLLAPEGAGALIAQERPTHLLHLAWYTEHGRFWTSPENLRWVDASLRLLQAFAAAGGRRAVVAGTCAEYDWVPGGTFSEWRTPLRPGTLYGAAKLGLHEIARGLAAQEGMSLAWGRIFFSFGPGEPEGRLVPSIARALLAGREAPMTHGRQLRDTLTVADLGRAFATLTASDFTGPVNIGSGERTSLRELAELVAAEVGRPDLLRVGALEPRPGEPREILADVTRLREHVGWRPTDTLAEGVARTVAALR